MRKGLARHVGCNKFELTEAGWEALGSQTCRHCLATICRENATWVDDKADPATCMRARNFQHAPQTEQDRRDEQARRRG